MSAPLVIPFNYDQGTTELKTTSYTVGAGKYCYAVPLDPRCTVNGVEIFLSNTISFSISTATAISMPATGPGFCGKIVASASAVNKEYGFISYSGTTTTATQQGTAVSGAGITIYFYNGYVKGTGIPALGAAEIKGVYMKTDSAVNTTYTIQHANLKGAWYKAGDVLAGSSAEWLVTEYNSIT
jgi:hypothetical protein